MIKNEFGNEIKEYHGESCSWCKNEDSCDYNRKIMEATREVIKNVIRCSSAYCSAKVTCDYYVKDEDKYIKYHVGEYHW